MTYISQGLQKGNTALIVVVVVAVALLIGGFVAYTNNQQAPTTFPEVEKSVDMSEGENMMVEDGSEVMMDEETKVDIMTDPDSLTAVLADVSGGNSSGTGYVLRKDGKLTHMVVADLPDPEEGTVYEGWLVNKTPTLKFFSTGVLEQGDDGKYSVSYMSDNLYEGYNFVVITLETVVDETPEDHIIEGTAN